MTTKAEETRERILNAALQLFREKGFDETTMRDVAAAAEMATGAAYYYFRSKEELVMALYVRSTEEKRTFLPAAVERSKDLKKRLRVIIDANFEQFADHRRLFRALARIGMDPSHALSPFAKETAPMRDEGIDYFRTALDGTKVPKDIAEFLPRLLWLYQVGLIFFWVYDESPSQRRTERLVDGTLEIIVRLIQLSSLPLIGPLRKRVASLVRDVSE
ncbi:MAG TPA: TetR family transcriptional regulator [Thermoanaerobaculia bacterium]|nr:TetR family transcriptional regulator [Thermoanaerobaculia bacterium]